MSGEQGKAGAGDGRRSWGGAALSALLGLAFAAGALIGACERPAVADEHELPGTLGVFGPTRLGSAVYPRQEIPLHFKHSAHIAAKIACERCHVGASASTKAADNLFPRGVSCDGCHGQQHPRAADAIAQCEYCHSRASGGRVSATLQAPRPNLHFSHKAHVDRGSTCESCHGDMSKVRLATVLQLPSEASCLSCHDGLKASNRCATCHPSESGGRLVTRDFADRTAPMLVPRGPSGWGAAHDLAFVEDHRGIAKANPSLCAQCHTESQCVECHAGAVRPMRIHAGDCLTTHALDARAATQDCQSCHRAQSD
ncbi:MAG: cytochrome c3 family protein, partial [Myxococcales bacterium]|nr:cytochrome c3 family protein [Myxococcales bacterium]